MDQLKPVKLDGTNYDATYKIGNTTVNFVAPKITEAEKQQRLEAMKRTIISMRISRQVRKEIRNEDSRRKLA